MLDLKGPDGDVGCTRTERLGAAEERNDVICSFDGQSQAVDVPVKTKLLWTE